MTKRTSIFLVALASTFVAAPSVFGQSVIQVSITANGKASSVASGGSLALVASDLGQPILANVTVRYSGTATATITGVSLTGTSEMTLLVPAQTPAALSPNGTTSFTVEYLPSSGNAANAQISVVYTENSQPSAFLFTIAGTSPRLAFSYYFPPTGSLTDLNSGDRITFPATNAGSSAQAIVSVINRGTAAGSLQSISLSGSAFQLAGSPAPVQLQPGQQASFSVTFIPQGTGGSQGLITVTLASSTVTFALAGTGTTANFSASYALADGNLRPLTSGTSITFPSVDVNGNTTATITILNQGPGTGTVSSIAVGGAGFQVTGLSALPATVASGQSLHFNIVFNPTQSGAFNGNFTIFLTGSSISGTLLGSTTSPSFTLTYALADSIIHALPSGTTINFPAIDINGTTTANITILNQGAGSGTVTAISLSGNGFQLTGVPLLPLTLAGSQGLRIGIVFNPTQAGTYNGTFRIDLTGSSITGSLTASTAASNISLSYIDPDTNNVVPLSNNSSIPFPNTLSGAVSNITVVATNSGAGTGFINAVTLGGSSPSAFQLLNLPSLPVAVPPSQQVRFGVRFSPQQQQGFSAALLVTINTQALTVNLAGQGTGPQFTYTWTSGSGSTALLPNGTLPVADTTVGQTTSVTVSILNAGTGDGQISSIGVTGQGLALSGVPVGTITLHANASQQFTLNFAPLQPGSVKGTLTIGNDSFTVTASGIGSKLSFTYTNAAVVTQVTEGGAVIFPPSPVGTSESLTFSIQNTGTSAATISSINLASASTVFSLQQLPTLPLSLNPGVTITLSASFLPNNTGTLTATLAVNSSTFTLSGTGTQPALLPAFQFQGPSGTQQPGQQPAVGLTLSSPFALALKGTLTLTFVSSVFTDDPAIQFANGGRTITFTIPANTTQALFNGTATSVPIQTGTTAGTLVITPTFAMQNGFDMTPASPTILSLTVQRSAPQLLNASVTSETTSSFTVLLNGYSTSRNLRQLDIQVTPQQGSTFSTSHLTLDVSTSASAWFQSATSQPFGGTFSIAIPFVLQNGNSTQDLVHLIQSLSITATNDVGTSSAMPVPIP